jgi:DNA segregation ATPase FtsK/SpoIIIE, S-DNA-T family
MAKKKTGEEPVRSGVREIIGSLVAVAGLMWLLAIISYHPSQIDLFLNDPRPKDNMIGPLGAQTAFFSFMYFGAAGYAIPFALMWIGGMAIFRSGRRVLPRILWFVLALFCLAGLVESSIGAFWFRLKETNNIGSAGGLMGEMMARRSVGAVIGLVGAQLLFWVLLCIAVVRFFSINLIALAKMGYRGLKSLKVKAPDPAELVEKKRPKPIEKKKRPAKKATEKLDSVDKSVFDLPPVSEVQGAEQRAVLAPVGDPEAEPRETSKTKQKAAKLKITKEASDAADQSFSSFSEKTNYDNYTLPSVELLDPPVKQREGMSADQISQTAEILQGALEEFGVEAKVTGVQQGPVVTCYEIAPAAGVRVERIKALSDNLALKMHAESIRIQAPIPGRGVCGVEIPNTTRASVFFRELIESKAFQSGKDALPLILGKDTSGKSMIYDLAKMPHLLIAGATGAGKSVCMNSILTGLLMRHGPDDLRLILVDPKTVEFQAYNNLPHLVVPVITNAKKVALGLKWAIDEMERRFKWFSQTGVRDLPGFNSRVQEQQADLFGEELDSSASRRNQLPEKLPYIVIVIDELADLMAVAQAEIEAGIARLAAKSRAAGIHMILATQRPDVKVITGTIKANFPVRIAFKVSQKVDSRTILDRMGADALLGKGDMLLLPPGSDKLIRSQGCYTSDGEIDRVTQFCKEQGMPDFIADIHEKLEKPTADIPDMDSGEDDDILEQALEVIRQTKRASTSSLQRRLRIGYTRAARLMDLLEERGFVGPPNGSDPREILIDLDGEIPQNPGAEEHGSD